MKSNGSRSHLKYLVVVLACVVSMLLHVGRAAAASPQPYNNAVKITFLSWTSGSTKISYERAFPSIAQSGELCGSVIGAGYDKYKNKPLGFTVRYGHKFFVAGYTPQKPLMGFYLRPELMYSHYTYAHSQSKERTLAQMGALLATLGYQLTLRHFILDAWVGGGYAFGAAAETGYHHGFQLWRWFGRRNDNIAMSFSIRIGVVW